MFNIAKPIAAIFLSASVLCTTPGFSAGIGGPASYGASHIGTENLVLPVKQKRHERRDLKPGEVIAGAILFGILGAAVASGAGNRNDRRYSREHENGVKAATKACNRSARKWFRNKFPAKPRVNAKNVTYDGKNRYSVNGVVSNRNNRNKHRFYCSTRNGNVRKFSVR